MSSSLIKQVYLPPTSTVNFSLEQWLGTDLVRYYSLGRYALVEALRISGVGRGDCIALPEFICRDVLVAIKAIGASVYYYPVDEMLRLVDSTQKLKEAKVIIIVNYFGFPQELSVFETLAKESGAVLIEDNAHGFLGRDIHGVPLGTRCTLGLISMRKSLASVNGAALILNDVSLAHLLPLQLNSNDSSLPLVFRVKQMLRRLVPLMGIQPCRAITWFIRMLRKIRTGDAINIAEDSDTLIPAKREPHGQFFQQLRNVSVDAEIIRRRKLYKVVEKEISSIGGVSIFSELPQGVSPYVFPFRMKDEMINLVRQRLKSRGLECHRWPDLPDEVLSLEKLHYSNVWMVPFIW